ncbi:nodulin-26-like [Pyrus ussuriensis x Pyrus communis]|uniref:Nodulin-26-like n=1 Tax=Pyrus ussuriensis x Pyrus communis TaxID=2448454 RepID=A0A5N5HG60_9ROSA|nr:nodulin-26-like [Pyrus ussuriensis x Pyrus communis]
MKAEPITTTKYTKRRNCIWRTTQNPLIITVVGKFVKGGCYPPQERFGPTPVFGNVSSNAVGDEHGSPTIQETSVENLSPGEASIPRAIG